MTAAIRTLIVDDEPLARDLIQRLLSPESDIEICKVCDSGRAATEAISELKPELVFLDIRMPDLDGLSVIRALPPEHAPLFVMVTAFTDHAVDAFSVRAFDYVLKPIDKERFARTLRDARAAVLNRRTLCALDHAQQLDADTGDERREQFTHLRIRAGDRLLRLPIASVRFFEAASQYVQADFAAGAHLLSTESLGSLEAKLPKDQFYRIHRSFLVNAAYVQAVAGNSLDGLCAVLKDGRRLPIARRNRPVAEALMIHLGAGPHEA